MSAVVQMEMLPFAQSRLYSAKALFQEKGVVHNHFQDFTRAIALAWKSAPAGSLIVAASPMTTSVVEVMTGTTVEAGHLTSDKSTLGHVVVSATTRPNHRMLMAVFEDRYTRAVNAYDQSKALDVPWTQPCGSYYPQKTACSRLVHVLKVLQPPLVVIENGHEFRCPRDSVDDLRANWQMLIDIARQSQVTHVIFAPATTALEILADPNFCDQVQLAVLHPYKSSKATTSDDGKNDEADKIERFTHAAIFKSALSEYGSCLPWHDQDSFESHSDFIDNAVGGDLGRARKWILRALDDALSEPRLIDPLTGTVSAQPNDALKWDHFKRTKPRGPQSIQANTERTAAYTLSPAHVLSFSPESLTASSPPQPSAPVQPIDPKNTADARPNPFKSRPRRRPVHGSQPAA